MSLLDWWRVESYTPGVIRSKKLPQMEVVIEIINKKGSVAEVISATKTLLSNRSFESSLNLLELFFEKEKDVILNYSPICTFLLFCVCGRVLNEMKASEININSWVDKIDALLQKCNRANFEGIREKDKSTLSKVSTLPKSLSSFIWGLI